jgi:DNA-binding NtrC family response regulator
MAANIKVLIIEDEVSLRKSLTKLLELKKYQVEEAENFITAAQKISNYHYGIFLLDLRLPGGNGIELLKNFKLQMEHKTIIMTAHATFPSAVEAIKNGAFYYLEKPLDEDLLFIQMEKILELTLLREKNLSLKNELTNGHSSGEIIYESKAMAGVVALAGKFAGTGDSVLIQGNTGVGKEIIARFIHRNSNRRDKIFLPINCSSIPEQLFESELFGFKKGAFTGAAENYNGRYIQADQGTLFLDEIGEMPLPLQSKMLRILEDGEIYRLGSTKPQKVDVRVIAATNKDLWEETQAGRFRKDLYFRLKEGMIHIPPLRERKEDILPLVRHFIAIYNTLFEKKITGITKEAEAYLLEYPWEGNVRELKNMVKSIFSVKDSAEITISDLMLTLRFKGEKKPGPFATLQEHELQHIKNVLEANNKNIKKTARVLGISRARLYRKLELLNINIEEEPGGKE